MINLILQAAVAERKIYEFSWIFMAVFIVFMILFMWIINGIIDAKKKKYA